MYLLRPPFTAGRRCAKVISENTGDTAGVAEPVRDRPAEREDNSEHTESVQERRDKSRRGACRFFGGRSLCRIFCFCGSGSFSPRPFGGCRGRGGTASVSPPCGGFRTGFGRILRGGGSVMPVLPDGMPHTVSRVRALRFLLRMRGFRRHKSRSARRPSGACGIKGVPRTETEVQTEK